METSKLTWVRFPKISKDVLNNAVLLLEPISLKIPEPSVGFAIWLSFLALIGRLNNFLDEALTRAGNLFLRVRNNLSQFQKYLAYLVQK